MGGRGTCRGSVRDIPHHGKVKLGALCWALDPMISGHRDFNFICLFIPCAHGHFKLIFKFFVYLVCVHVCISMCTYVIVCAHMCAYMWLHVHTRAHTCAQAEANAAYLSQSLFILVLRQGLSLNLQLQLYRLISKIWGLPVSGYGNAQLCLAWHSY